MARIRIYIGRHLCTAPRAVKEADALAASGHVVSVHGLWFDSHLVERDRALLKQTAWSFEPYADRRSDTCTGRYRWFMIRARARLAREVFVRTSRVMADTFGYGTMRLYQHARNNPADLAIFHSEGGLWAAAKLRACGRTVGMDFEDWFSRDLPIEQRTTRPIHVLAQLEAAALHFGPYVSTTSHALADALAKTYHSPAPTVIYNTFPVFDAPSSAPAGERVSLHWFSQTIGPGRGLELLFSVLPNATGSWRLVLRGDDPTNYVRHLTAQLPMDLQSRIQWSATVPNAELPFRIAEHDIGLALETTSIPNKNLTVSNKLFQYLQAGLAVIATDTAGHREVLGRAPDAGILVSESEPTSLSRALQSLGSDRVRLSAMKHSARRAAMTVFAHERQVPRYNEMLERALGIR